MTRRRAISVPLTRVSTGQYRLPLVDRNVQVSAHNRALRYTFQAGHAGSIPVARSLGLVLIRGFDSPCPLSAQPKSSGIHSDVLNADYLLPFVRCHGVPDGHTVRGQVQFVRAWQSGIHLGTDPPKLGRAHPVVGRPRAAPPIAMVRVGPRSPARMSRESGRDDRSIVDAPRLCELAAREHWRVITRARITLDARLGHCSSDLTPQPTNLGPQRVQLSARDGDHLG